MIGARGRSAECAEAAIGTDERDPVALDHRPHSVEDSSIRGQSAKSYNR